MMYSWKIYLTYLWIATLYLAKKMLALYKGSLWTEEQ